MINPEIQAASLQNTTNKQSSYKAVNLFTRMCTAIQNSNSEHLKSWKNHTRNTVLSTLTQRHMINNLSEQLEWFSNVIFLVIVLSYACFLNLHNVCRIPTLHVWPVLNIQ